MSTHNYTIFNMKKKITLNLQLWDFFPRDSRTSSKQPCERAISVRATEVLLYKHLLDSLDLNQSPVAATALIYCLMIYILFKLKTNT